ncbi:7485_t:CDS:10 [Ambispora leptoticha]|uniref:7485_t:CDS:1 n=1 Tax=Ambispora leptoticha TaxID=144679 RepID=A0A9N8WI10_9GLOM|nr:7485_t:CDS:10 [Ambispora leptoticha]
MADNKNTDNDNKRQTQVEENVVTPSTAIETVVSIQVESEEKHKPTNQNDKKDQTWEKLVEYSKKLEIGGQKVLVVENEESVISGEGATEYCVLRSPEHIAALKAKIDELKLNSERIEKERQEALSQSESVSRQLNVLVRELKQLGHNTDSDSEQTIHATVHTFGALQKLEIIADEDEEHDAYDRLIRAPRVRQYWHDGTLHREAEERSSSFTELFWDLVFVGAVGILGHQLINNISSEGAESLEIFFITFYPVWRIWLDMQSYLNIYSSNDLIQKFLMLWEMIIIITMVGHSRDIKGETGQTFIVAYVIGRMSLFVLYMSLAQVIPLFRVALVSYAWGIFIPSVLWIVASFVSSENKKALIWAAIAFDIFWQGFVPIYNRFGTKNPANHVHTRDFERVGTITDKETGAKSGGTLPPVLPLSRVATRPHRAIKTRGTEYQWRWKDWFSVFKIQEYRPALNIEHWSERCGVFIIICIGEIVFAIIQESWNAKPDWILGKSILGLLLAYDLHWIYFDVDASQRFQHALRRHVITGVLFGFAHFPLAMSLIAIGNSLSVIIAARDFSGGDLIPTGPGASEEVHAESASTQTSVDEPVYWLLSGSLALAIYCMAFIGVLHKSLDEQDSLRISKKNRIALRIIVGATYMILPVAKLNSCDFLIIVSLLSLLLVMVETYGRLRKKDPLFGNCDDDIIGDVHGEAGRRYIRWRWGPNTSNQDRWSRGILRRRRKENPPNEGNGNQEKIIATNGDSVDVVEFDD